MKTEFLDHVEDIIDAMEKAELIVAGSSYNVFAKDFRLNFAVVRALEIVGEATKRLPETVRVRYPEIPWRAMAGMRDKIIHGYDNVDLRIVWDTVTKEVPKIKPLLKQILADYEA